MIKRISLVMMVLLLNTAFAGSGALFNVTTTGIPLLHRVGFTLCLDITGDKPISCQDYTTQYSILSIRTTIPNHTYSHAGIRINTPGYTYKTQSLRENTKFRLAPNFVPLSTMNPIFRSKVMNKIPNMVCQGSLV